MYGAHQRESVWDPSEDIGMYEKAENPHIEEETAADQRKDGYPEAYVITEAAEQLGIVNTDVPHGPTFKDLTGMQFGKWKVLKYVKGSAHGSLYLCQCSCGRSREIWGGQLTSGRSQSCGKPGCRVRKGSSTLAKDVKYTIEPGDERLFRIWCELQELNNTKMWRCKADGKLFPIARMSVGITNWKLFTEHAHINGYNDKKVFCSKIEHGPLMPINESLPDGPQGLVVQLSNMEWIYPDQAEDEDRMLIVKPVKEKYYKDPTDGKVYTRAQLAEKYDIDISTFNSRLTRGWSIEKTCLGDHIPFVYKSDPNAKIWKD